jgi:hypothetical protein
LEQCGGLQTLLQHCSRFLTPPVPADCRQAACCSCVCNCSNTCGALSLRCYTIQQCCISTVQVHARRVSTHSQQGKQMGLGSPCTL